MKKVILGLILAISTTAITPAAHAAGEHNVGTNVNVNGTIYRIAQGTVPFRAAYTSAGAFLSYKFNSWNTVVNANSADIALPITTDGEPRYIIPRPGSLVNDNGTIYLITENNRAGFTSEAVFKGLGYSYKNVYPGDTSFMESTTPMNISECRHPMGTLVNDAGTFYIMLYKTKLGVSNLSVLDSWGYWVNDAVAANNFDRHIPEVGVLNVERSTSELTIMDTDFWQMDLDRPMPDADTLSIYNCWKA